LVFEDPILPEVPDIIKDLKADGVKVKIITGDNESEARYVCSRVGMNADHVITGQTISSLSDAALSNVAEKADVFARTTPAQKNRIIHALKRRGHVVGYLGDGINDAPSLHTADVGISISSAVDVAKETASIILNEHSLQVLHAGVMEGRKAFGNIIKYLLMGTSSNFGNMFSMAGAFPFLSFLPMLPTRILLNNFLYDFSQITIPTDNVDDTFVHKPRKWDVSSIRKFMIFIGPISSVFDFLTFFMMLHFFHASEQAFHTGWFIESLATLTLVLFVIRTQGNPFRNRPSKPLTITILGIVILGMGIPFLPLADWLGFVPLPMGYFLFFILVTIIYLGIIDIVKSHLMGNLIR